MPAEGERVEILTTSLAYALNRCCAVIRASRGIYPCGMGVLLVCGVRGQLYRWDKRNDGAVARQIKTVPRMSLG
jgi:hypothetical protein